MTDDLDRLLRTTVTDLAAESQPRDLMPGVRAHARRIRLVQGMGYLVASLTVLLLLLVPYLSVNRDSSLPPVLPGPPTASAVPSTSRSEPAAPGLDRPIALPHGWVVTAANQNDFVAGQSTYSWILNRATGRYTRLAYPMAWPAPTGSRAAVVRPGDGVVGLLDLRTNGVQWLGVGLGRGAVQWSPDGSRLLFTGAAGSAHTRTFVVVDVATAQVHPHDVDASSYPCNDDCGFTWYRDGRQVVLAQTDTGVAHSDALPDVQLGLRLFDADTGAPGALLPIHGFVAHAGDWSPDGRSVLVTGTVVDGASRHAQYQVVDAATGQVRSAFPGQPLTSWWVDNGRLLALSDRLKICVLSPTGAAETCITLPTDLFQLDVTIGPA